MKEEIASEHIKKYALSLILHKMPIKITRQCYFTFTRMVKIKRQKNINSVCDDGKIEKLIPC